MSRLVLCLVGMLAASCPVRAADDVRHDEKGTYLGVLFGPHEYINASVYKKELEVTGDNTVIISETNSRPGYFNISATNIKSQLKAGKKLKLYLLLNPSNPMMMIPSRRVYLGDLVMK